MQTRESINSKNRTLYELEDEEDVETNESLYDDYWDDEEDYSDESLYDYDYEYDYDYDDEWERDIAPTTETLQNPSRPRYEMPVSVKAQFTFWIFAGLLLLTLLGLRCIEKGNKVSRVIAVTALGVGVVGAVLQMLMAWQVMPVMESTGTFSYSLSVMAKTTIVISLATIMTISCALIMRIRESEMTVEVLKWVAAGCGLMFWILVTIVIFSSDYSAVDKIFSAGVVLLSCCIVSWVTAWIMSRFSSETTQIKPTQPEPNTVEPTRIDIVDQQTSWNGNTEPPTDSFESN